MKKNHASHHILDFSISDDLITYPACNSTLPLKKDSHNIGIIIAELKDWNSSIEFLNTLYRFSLIDSFSIQFDIGDLSRIFILMKLTGIGTSELKFRYYNLKKHIDKTGFELTILRSYLLENSYISILGIQNLSLLRGTHIIRESRNHFYIDKAEHEKIYYFLGLVDFAWISQHNQIRLVTEILYASNLQCSLVFYSKNLGNYSENCYYLVGATNNLNKFSNQLVDILAQCHYPYPIRNLFHPFLLGRILTRGLISTRHLNKTKSPTILSSRFIDELQEENSHKEFESLPINNFDSILHNISFKQKSKQLYTLFNGEVILFRIEEFTPTTISVISDQITNSFHYCILFFEKTEDCTNFTKKIQGFDMKKTLVISEYPKLKKIIEKFKKKYSSQNLCIP